MNAVGVWLSGYTAANAVFAVLDGHWLLAAVLALAAAALVWPDRKQRPVATCSHPACARTPDHGGPHALSNGQPFLDPRDAA